MRHSYTMKVGFTYNMIPYIFKNMEIKQLKGNTSKYKYS